MKSAKINFSPIQGGSGTPSPTNVRPINGWTNLSLYHSGENLYIPNSNNKGYISKSGVITVDETSTYTDLIPVNLGDVYSFECTTVSVNGDTNRRIHGYDSSGTWVKQLTSGTTAANTVEYRKISATIPAGISYIRISFRNQDTNVRITKENIVETNWQTAAGTIYGGYVNLATGELTATWGSVDIGDITWTLSNNTTVRQAWRTDSIHVKGISSGNDPYHGISPTLKTVSQNATWKPYMLCGGQTTQPSRTYLSVPPGAYANSTELRADMSGVLIIYELATPQTYQLTPITIKTLRGQNNIWSNANGPVEIKYWTH